MRRHELLSSLGLRFSIIVSNVDEKRLEKKHSNPVNLVRALSLAKAEAVKKIVKDKIKNYLIIGADTIIFLKKNKGEIIGKPKDRKEAVKILNSLKNNSHQVITGLTLISKDKKKTFTVSTKVIFKDFSKKERDDYLNTNVYLDRAGAYGIQDFKCSFVDKYEGSYNNILGFPTKKLLQILPEFGISLIKTDK